MKKIKTEELMEKIAEHQKWLRDKTTGKCLDASFLDFSDVDFYKIDFHGADFRDANFSDAEFSDADFCGANLRDANLLNANLSGTNLRYANLRDADLNGAILHGCMLYGADLTGANLRGADLTGAYLRNAKLDGANMYGSIGFYLQCPETGAFIGWKSVGKHIIKLQITEMALRSSATGRKCRCSEALVLSIDDGALQEVINYNYFFRTVYKVGEVVRPDRFDTCRWEECTNGIHFFMTRKEAEEYCC